MARPAVGAFRRPARFLVMGVHIDAERSCTLTIDQSGAHPVARIRARGAHREYVVPLGIACEVLHARAVKLGPAGVVISREKD